MSHPLSHFLSHPMSHIRWLRQAAASPTHFRSLLRRSAKGEPLQYILGTQPFGPLNLLVRPPVLIPRPETEHWSIKLSSIIPRRPISLLDLGTGSGCIPLLLAHLAQPGSLHAYGVDISPIAIQLATDNAARCNIPSSLHHTHHHLTNTFTPFLASFTDPINFPALPPLDVVTSNPPYISSSDYNNLHPSVKDYEDKLALHGGTTGLDFYHAIATLISRPGFLAPRAIVALEVGDGQADLVQEIMRSEARLSSTTVWLDPWGKRRTVLGHM